MPKRPVYIASSREVLAEEIEQYSLHQEQWVPIGPATLLSDAVRDISAALVEGCLLPFLAHRFRGLWFQHTQMYERRRYDPPS